MWRLAPFSRPTQSRPCSSGSGEKSQCNSSGGSSEAPWWSRVVKPRGGEEFADGASDSTVSAPIDSDFEVSSFEADYEEQDHVLGTGASGEVREAICRQTGESVAVKRYDKLSIPAAEFEDIAMELQVHCSLQHPGVVELRDVYESNDSVHVVMEKLEGGELLDRLMAFGRFQEVTAAVVATQILRTLTYLHSKGIMHRDIKCDNIMFVRRGSHAVKLVDFSFATKVDQDVKPSGPYGTCGYMAPEVLSGGSYDEMADMWSLGSVVYSMLTGLELYAGDQADICRKNKAGSVDWHKSFSDLSTDAQDFVRSLLVVDAEQRPCAQEALRHPWLQRLAPEAVSRALAEAECMEMALQQRAFEHAKETAPITCATAFDALRRLF